MKIGRGVNQKIIINVEKYWVQKHKPGKVSDCLILCCFLEKKKIVIVELKKGDAPILDAVQKIKNVCDSIRDFLNQNSLIGFNFYPVVLSGYISPIEIKLLFSQRISLEGKSEQIIRENCNITLEYIFNKYD